MELQSTGHLVIGNGGWVLFEGRDLPIPVYARFALATSGRLEVHELYIAGNGRLSSGVLRSLPLPLLETLANEPGARDGIMSRLGTPGPDLRRLAAHLQTTPGPKVAHWVARSMRAQVKGSGEPQAPMPRRKPWRPQVMQVPDLRVAVPKTVPYPDEFYVAIADAYRFLALVSARPAVELADANNVPPSTTRRWIKEARRRGLLAPGQKGRAG